MGAFREEQALSLSFIMCLPFVDNQGFLQSYEYTFIYVEESSRMKAGLFARKNEITMTVFKEIDDDGKCAAEDYYQTRGYFYHAPVRRNVAGLNLFH